MRWTRGNLTLFLLAAAGCSRAVAPLPAPVVVTPPVLIIPAVPLSNADLDTIAELIRLEDRREYDAARFGMWARAQHTEVRRRAIIGAGRIGNRAATSLIIAALSDSVAAVRRDAAFALGEVNDTSQIAPSLTALANVTRQPDSVGIEAITAIGRIGTAQGYAIAESILMDTTAAPDLRSEALLALKTSTNRSRNFDLALPFASNANPETRWRSLYVMTRTGTDPRAVPQLLASLADTEPGVRALAARALRAATVDSASQRAQAYQALTRALGDAHAHVRINSALALGSYRTVENVAALARLLGDTDGNVAIAAVQALADNGGAEAELTAAARSHAHIGIRSAALTALAGSPATRTAAFDLARSKVRDPNWLERLFAVRVIGNRFNPTAIEELRPLIGDRDGRVAAAALGALVNADTVNPPYALFIEKLADPDPGVRAAAVRGVQRKATPADQEMFLRAYERAERDVQRHAREAAVDALGTLSRQGVPVDRAFFLRFKKPTDPLLHARVVQRLGPGTWGAIRPIDTGRDIQFYRTIARRFFGGDSAASRPQLRLRTAAGEFVMELNGREAPLTVFNFLSLAERGYFNNGRWHRVVPNFVLQDGDSRGDGSGSPGTVIRDEINRLRYTRGAIGMALSGPDTGGSQWFIAHSPQPHLDGGYTVFGTVVSGMDVADRVVQEDPIISIDVVK